MQKKAHREFYFRPKIILKGLKNINNLDKLKLYLNAAIAFLGIGRN